MSSVAFKNLDRKPLLKDKQKLKDFIRLLFSEYSIPFDSLTIVFCSDEYLLTLNQQFLKHDYYTDILTFDLSTGSEMTGEIYISFDRVKDNAKKISIPTMNELLRVVFHGVLHLCGFKDKTSSQKSEMTRKENEALEKFTKFHVKQ